jgi:hypothetical protein
MFFEPQISDPCLIVERVFKDVKSVGKLIYLGVIVAVPGVDFTGF